ncbi:sepiapterin reductase [Cavenderia fasciculata]|uniref:Sepiapterin reductase n=1 Tax=Cavenderia fasciculata TaxID=261658 RepID=F4PQL6_CACFS|nr:sepiapterin reductase [Cavenderia fasciculata]EGG21183.1 sepiapterin reductase [Cavenderia fasciculata]|eukprot:XP_004359033.1 sepiapterin reductase [Cavenderia fasciculata]
MKILALVTGASRGFGYSIVDQLIKETTNRLPNDDDDGASSDQNSIVIDLYLYARSLGNLESTEKMVREQFNNKSINVLVNKFAIDFCDIQDTEIAFRNSLINIEFKDYQKVIFFNNHGALSILKRVDSLSNFKQISNDIHSNLTSFVVTNSIFMEKIKEQNNPILPNTSFFLINVSSLAAIKAYDAWSIYCSAKAGYALNYAPGPMDTDMQAEIRANTVDQESKRHWVDMKDSGKLVCPFDSASKLVRLIFDNNFESAAHIDYYDQEW